MPLYNFFSVQVEMILHRHDQIIPDLDKKSSLTPPEKILLQQAALDLFNNQKQTIYMYLFYNAAPIFSGVNLEIVKPLEYKITNNKAIFSTTVNYTFPQSISDSTLKEQVKGIFAHWFNSGDITYRLKKFRITSHKKLFGPHLITNSSYIQSFK